MSKLVKRLILVIALLATIALVAGCTSGSVASGKEGASSPVPTNGLVQSNTDGAVTIEVKWLGLAEDRLALAVAMDTHSVDLDRYDLGKLAVLRDDEGQEYRPTAWDAAAGGHHRQGRLTFPVPTSLIQGKTASLVLIIPDIAGVEERTFSWKFDLTSNKGR